MREKNKQTNAKDQSQSLFGKSRVGEKENSQFIKDAHETVALGLCALNSQNDSPFCTLEGGLNFQRIEKKMTVSLSELFNPKGWVEVVWEDRELRRSGICFCFFVFFKRSCFYLSWIKTPTTGHMTLKSMNPFDAYGSWSAIQSVEQQPKISSVVQIRRSERVKYMRQRHRWIKSMFLRVLERK